MQFFVTQRCDNRNGVAASVPLNRKRKRFERLLTLFLHDVQFLSVEFGTRRRTASMSASALCNISSK